MVMAQVTDLPEEDLRKASRGIPGRVLADLEPIELRLRVLEYERLLDEALQAPGGARARALRAKADRVLNACTPASFLAVKALIEEDVRLAELDQAHTKAEELRKDWADFAWKNPQPRPELVVAAMNELVMQVPGAQEELAKQARQSWPGKLPPIPPPRSRLWNKRKAR